MICPKCNSLIADGSNFCTSCGAKIQSTIVCGKCGKDNSQGTKFCIYCGNNLTVTRSVTPEPTNPQQNDRVYNQSSPVNTSTTPLLSKKVVINSSQKQNVIVNSEPKPQPIKTEQSFSSRSDSYAIVTRDKSFFQKFKIPLFIVLGLCLLVGIIFFVTRNKDKFSGDKAQVEQSSDELSSIKDYEDKFERLWMIGKTRDYTPEDLQGWSKDDLKILRNYFFARNNYYFAPADLRNYFSKYSWYKPLYKEAGDWFSDLEINNVQYIKKLEGLSNYYQER